MNIEEYQELFEENKSKEPINSLIDYTLVPNIYQEIRELIPTTITPSTFSVQGGIRRSGRTNKMIFQAIVALCEGKNVCIVTPVQSVLHTIQNKLEAILDEAGMGYEFKYKVTYYTQNNLNIQMRGREVAIFYDHTCSQL